MEKKLKLCNNFSMRIIKLLKKILKVFHSQLIFPFANMYHKLNPKCEKTLSCVLDTGSNICVLTQNLVNKFRLTKQMSTSQRAHLDKGT